MKVALVNNSGNVGKSFLSRELFYPNMKDGVIIEVETHNSSSSNFNVKTEKIKGNDFKKLFPLMYKYDEFVVDVGASQIIPFLNELSKNSEIFEDIDFIIIPTTNDDKIQEDTIKTIMLLENLGLGKKVRVILNKADHIEEFDNFFSMVKENTEVSIYSELRILQYDILNNLDSSKKCAFELANDDTDFKALSREAFKSGDDEEGTTLAELDYLKTFSKGIKNNMDSVYALLISTK